VFGCDSINGLPLNETTFAEWAKTKGYRTGMIGKWHLGQKQEFMPNARGFDYYYGLPYSVDMGCPREDQLSGNCTPPFSNLYIGQCYGLPLYEQTKIIQQPARIEELAPRYAQAAQSFIKSSTKSPFLLYVSFQHPHTTVAQQEDRQYSNGAFYHVSRRGRFGDAVEEMDWIVGQIMDSITDRGIERKTLVLFTSDNGPWMIMGNGGGSPGIFSAYYAALTYGYTDVGKGSTWEGGFREPGIAWWPGTIPAATVTQEVVTTMDIFATVLDVAGIPLPGDRVFDGRSLLPILVDPIHGETSHGHVFYWRAGTLFAARQAKGPYKVHYYTQSGYVGDLPVNQTLNPLIFHVEKDPSEQFPLDPTTTEYQNALIDINQAVAAHLDSIIPVQNHLDGMDPNLSICCDQNSVPICTCGCN